MRKTALILALLLGCMGLQAQNYHINIHRSDAVIYHNDVNTIDIITFGGTNPVQMFIHDDNGLSSFPIRKFDSITFSLGQVEPPAVGNDYMSICDDELPYTWQGITFTEGGTQMLTLQTEQGADSVVMLHLTVFPTQTINEYMTVCADALPYNWQGMIFTEAGTQSATFQTVHGCDSIVTRHLSVGDNIMVETVVEACDSYTWLGSTYTATGDYEHSFVSASGCDSIEILHLTIHPTQTSDDYLTVDESDLPYIWQGVTFTEEGIKTVILQTVHGCDSIVTLHLTVTDTVYITYANNDVTVVNPFVNNGVSVSNSGADVVVNATRTNVPYVVAGSSSNGSLTLNSSNAFFMALSNLSLTSGSTAAINIATPADATLNLRGSSSIADYANSALIGALQAAGSLTINGGGTLNVTGNAKHGIAVEGTMTMNSGTINILGTDSDGIHGSSNLQWNGGTLTIASAGSDGLDFSGAVTIANGNLSINTTAEAQRGIKVSGLFTMSGGSLGINTSGTDGKGIKADSDLNITGGTLTIVNSGDMSKGLKCDGQINISGGTIDITASGSTVLETVEGQNVPAYCSAIKCDTDINITGGDFTLTLPTSNQGGKGISADGNLTIDGATMNITTQGNGASYTVSGSTKDAYTSACLRSDGNMSILSGNLTLISSGTGGKGINVGDDDHTTSTLIIGTQGGDDDDLILNVTTSGERITVSSGGGWPGPGGGGGDYANPKGIKSRGNLTINSGTITVNCTQNNEGGECIESKATLTINGGNIETYSKTDDPINARTNLTINGGTVYSHSDNNDGIDSNGTLFLNGGFVISNGARQPEEGFDCDNNQFKITGGTHIGTGGATSNPTTNVCTQPSLKINTQSGYAIQILKSDGTVICTYQCPTLAGGGGGWPGPGGGSGLVMLFTDPQLQTGQSYTVKYNGTISGGTNWNGYYTGNPTYTGGQTVTVNVNSMLTTVNAGGGGW